MYTDSLRASHGFIFCCDAIVNISPVTMATGIMVRGKQVEPKENPQLSAGCWQTFPCMAGEEDFVD